jgi:hypothetical protein
MPAESSRSRQGRLDMQHFSFRSRLSVLVLFIAVCLLPWAAHASSVPTATMVVTFSIRDYASWRPVFDAAGAERAKAGVTNGRVYRNADKPNSLLVLFDSASEPQGRAWMNSADVRAAWKRGGVVGEPSFHFLR